MVKDGTINVRNGHAIIKLRAGESISILDLPDSTTYSINESDLAGFVLTEAVGDNGEIEADRAASATFTNTYSSSGEVVIETSKVLHGTNLKNSQFTFELCDEFGELLETAKNDGTGNVVFSPLSYTQADDGKTFTYYIYETRGSEANMEYDESQHEVSVTVNDNGDGTMSFDVKYDGDEDKSVFENSWFLPLPFTGASGFNFISTLVVIIGGVWLILRQNRKHRRKS